MKLSSSLAVLTLAFAAASPAVAAITIYTTTLSGQAEATPNDSPGTGTATVTVDSVTSQIRIQSSFSALLSPSTVAHIHCCTPEPLTGTAGVATQTPTFVGFPAGVTSGSYDSIFDLDDASFYNPAFVTAEGGLDGAKASFLAGLDAGTSYFNIHSEMFPAGEIRGFLKPIPEPEAYALMLAGLAAMGAFMRRRKV